MVLWRIDIFPKFIDRNVHIKTFYGGLITLITISWIIFISIGRFTNFFFPNYSSTILLDTSPLEGPKKTFIYFNINISTPCTMLHLDHFENDGLERLDIIENITRTRYDENGIPIEISIKNNLKKNKNKNFNFSNNYCGSCYGALSKNECCNTCEDVIKAFEKKNWSFYSCDRWEQCIKENIINFGLETCNYKGYLKIKQNKGKFHIGLGRNNFDSSKGHIHDISSIISNYSLNHTIIDFYIGEQNFNNNNSLKLTNIKLFNNESNLWLINYYLNIIPFNFKNFKGFKYSTMYSQKLINLNNNKKGFPGLLFNYEFSPMIIYNYLNSSKLSDFLIDICGIIGGAFSFAAIIDALMFGALTSIESKKIIGKDV